ncbi:MAG: hypothetical protein K5707_04255 [Clostridia bacterium]|nr:hypothetical protein [Clostridia bacterium]
MTAIDMKRILTGYRDARERMDTIFRNLEELENVVTGISLDYSEPRVSSSPKTTDRFGEIIDRLAALHKESVAALETCIDRAEEVYRLVETLQDSKLNEVLSRRYIRGQNWKRIANEMGYDERWVYRLHDQALDALIQFASKSQ